MYLFVIKHDPECQKAIRLVSSRPEVHVVDMIDRNISSTNLAMDYGTSKIPLLRTGSGTVVSGYQDIEAYLRKYSNDNQLKKP